MSAGTSVSGGGDDPSYHPLPYRPEQLDDAEMATRASAFLALMATRRSVRMFAATPVPRALIEAAIAAAGTAPSGAHRQPWTFVAVSDPDTKAAIRAAAEAEERESYEHRMPDEWKRALAPLGTDAVKTHLTDAPWLVVLFAQRYEVDDDGDHHKNYYVTESCGIAAGMFLTAVHAMGLASLPHTPSPMGFLAEVLERPDNERPYLLLPVGHPAPDAVVPDLARKPLADIAVWR